MSFGEFGSGVAVVDDYAKRLRDIPTAGPAPAQAEVREWLRARRHYESFGEVEGTLANPRAAI
jgi:hypothetical protein